MYVILGATGHVGTWVADRLLDQGKPVRVVSRNIRRLKSCMIKGAIPFAGDISDDKFLSKAFAGATAVFSMIPPDLKTENLRLYQNKISDSIIKALKKSGVTHVVNLSSIGADLSEKTGPALGLHDHEEKLNKLENVNVLHLRAAYFMENLLNNIDLIKNKGFNGSAIRGDLKMPFIATKDIAEKAALYLSELNFAGKSVKYLLGQRDLSMIEISNIIGKAIGRDGLRYVQFSYDDAQKAIVDMGISEDMARSYIEMSRGFNEGWIYKGTERSPESTTKTSIEDFALEFCQLYCVGNPECQAVGL